MPDGFVPDDGFAPDDGFKPIEPKKNIIKKAYDTLFEPADINGYQAKVKSGVSQIDNPSLNDTPLKAKAKGFLAGAAQGVSNLRSTPANIIGAVAPEVGAVGRVAGKALGAVQALKGGTQIAEGDYGSGAGNVGMGLLGLIPNVPKSNALIPNEILPIGSPTTQRSLPLRQATQPRMLPPAINEPIIPKLPTEPSYFAGRAGVVPNRPVGMDVGPINPRMGANNQGTILNRELEGISNVNPMLAAEHGRGVGSGAPIKVPNIDSRLPAAYRPNTLAELPESEIAARAKYAGKGSTILPSAEPKGPVSRLRPVEPVTENPLRNVGSGVKSITNPAGKAAQKIIGVTDTSKPIVPTATPKEAVKNWANGRNAAQQHGENARREFESLSDPKLIDQFQAGVRSPELNKVQQHLDSLFKQEQSVGLLDDASYRDNYIRQYWDNSPEEVSKAFEKAGINFKSPAFAKQRFFDSYKEGIAAGLKPKYDNIADIVAARTAESKIAIKNKEFYDYLKASDQLKSGAVGEPTNWIFKGKNADKLAKYTKNYLGKGWEGTKKIADISSASKNIQLAGGIPGTKYNIHGWNTMWSDAKLRGYVPAFKEFVSDPTGKKAFAEFSSKENQNLLAKAMEHGYTHHPVEDAGARIKPFGDNVAARAVGKVEDAFEKPLFERALPALKFKGFKEVYAKLTKAGMEEAEALKQASTISNNFMGGINKSIRNKTGQDISRIIALAPDWLESRARLAMNDWKGAAKSVAGQGNAVDKVYAKSFARGAGKVGALTAGGVALGNKSDRPQDITALPAGTTSTGRRRDIDLMGTSDEGMRIPMQVGLRAAQGNPMDAIDLLGKNKMSALSSSAQHIFQGVDAFKRPIRGNDSYGKPIPATNQVMKHALEVTKPFQPQGLQAIINLMEGYGSPEEVGTQQAELPLRYSSEPKPKGFRMRKF